MDGNRKYELKERNVFFPSLPSPPLPFFFLLPAGWDVGAMAGAAAITLDLEVILRMEDLHGRVTSGKRWGLDLVACQTRPWLLPKEK